MESRHLQAVLGLAKSSAPAPLDRKQRARNSSLTGEATMFDLEQTIRERHSTRLFLSQPVPRGLVDESLALAVHAPSKSNIQPRHLAAASCPQGDRLVEALCNHA